MRARAQRPALLLAPPQPERKKWQSLELPSLGPSDAPVTVDIFAGYACPYSQRHIATIYEIAETFPERVRIVYHQLPLRFQSGADQASQAAIFAHQYGKFWDMSSQLYAAAGQLGPDELAQYASAAGLDGDELREVLASGELSEAVELQLAAAKEAGVVGTPTTIIGGRRINGAQPAAVFIDAIREELRRVDQGNS